MQTPLWMEYGVKAQVMSQSCHGSSTADFLGSISASCLTLKWGYPTAKQRYWIDHYWFKLQDEKLVEAYEMLLTIMQEREEEQPYCYSRRTLSIAGKRAPKYAPGMNEA